jgi:hypothetical protein
MTKSNKTVTNHLVAGNSLGESFVRGDYFRHVENHKTGSWQDNLKGIDSFGIPAKRRETKKLEPQSL